MNLEQLDAAVGVGAIRLVGVHLIPRDDIVTGAVGVVNEKTVPLFLKSRVEGQPQEAAFGIAPLEHILRQES